MHKKLIKKINSAATDLHRARHLLHAAAIEKHKHGESKAYRALERKASDLI